MPAARISLIAALATAALALFASSASASMTASKITAPADASYFLGEPTPAPITEMTVEGTLEGTPEIGTVEIECYSAREATLVAEVEETELKEVSAGKYSFKFKVPADEVGEEPCVLRAVPEGEAAQLGPTVESKFEGPRIAYSELTRREEKSGGALYSYEIEARTLSTIFEIDSAGACGLGPTFLVSSPGLEEGAEMFRCAGGLYAVEPGATRAGVQIGGRNAYDPESAFEILRKLGRTAEAPSSTLTDVFHRAGGLESLHENDPYYLCEGKTQAYPETAESCEKLVPAGVTLERAWTVTHAGRLIELTDTWHSTDAQAHSISALYGQETGSDLTTPGTFSFPGGAQGFAATTTGQQVALPAGEGAVLYRQGASAEEAVGSTHPLGAIAFDPAPSAPATFTAGSAESPGRSALSMPYSLELPAVGTRKITMAFAEGYTLAEVCSLSELAGSGCQPSLAITSPAAGSAGSAATVTVTGTASDPVALAGVSVNGVAATLNGSNWSATVPLQAGPNTITATATGHSGLTRSASTSVTYTPPAGGGKPPPGPAAAGLVGSIIAGNGKVVFSLKCTGPAGSKCAVTDRLTTVEKRRGSKITGLLAKLKKKQVTVAAGTQTINAGKTEKVTLRLNTTGRSLIKRFKKLPAKLTVTYTTTGRPASAIAKTLTITARHKR